MKHAHIPLQVLCAALLVCAHLSVFLSLAAPVSVWLPVLLGLTVASFAANLLIGSAVCCPRCGFPTFFRDRRAGVGQCARCGHTAELPAPLPPDRRRLLTLRAVSAHIAVPGLLVLALVRDTLARFWSMAVVVLLLVAAARWVLDRAELRLDTCPRCMRSLDWRPFHLVLRRDVDACPRCGHPIPRGGQS